MTVINIIVTTPTTPPTWATPPCARALSLPSVDAVVMGSSVVQLSAAVCSVFMSCISEVKVVPMVGIVVDIPGDSVVGVVVDIPGDSVVGIVVDIPGDSVVGVVDDVPGVSVVGIVVDVPGDSVVGVLGDSVVGVVVDVPGVSVVGVIVDAPVMEEVVAGLVGTRIMMIILFKSSFPPSPHPYTYTHTHTHHTHHTLLVK